MECTPIFKSSPDHHYYFGYYDKSPISIDGTKHLALRTDFIDHLPSAKDIAQIGYFDLTNGDRVFHPLIETRTFNWQQGCMLQWYGDRNHQIIFNDLYDDKFVSVIYDLNTQQKHIFPMPIYALSPDNCFALCVDHERHHWCRRGYSYDGAINPSKNEKIVQEDGIYRLDFTTGSLQTIIRLNDVLSHKPIDNMEDATHYIEHLMIAPNSNRFAFFHRWKLADGGIYTRLYTANCDGTDIYLLNDSGRMSHFCWGSNKQILGWGGVPNTVNTLRKYKNIVKYFIKPLLPLYKKMVSGNAIEGTTKLSTFVTGDSYILFEDKTPNKTKISLENLDRDGHPSFHPLNNEWIITDTYPDKTHIAQLILFNIRTNQKFIIARLSSMANFDNTPNRCDLHPKWSFDGRYVSIDTMNDNIRSIYIYDVHEVMNANSN